MSNENEEIKGEENETPKPEHHENWIERALDSINKEFPLSGGEQEEDLTVYEEKETAPEETTAKKKALDEDVNEKFPLSGGETDEDL